MFSKTTSFGNLILVLNPNSTIKAGVPAPSFITRLSPSEEKVSDRVPESTVTPSPDKLKNSEEDFFA